MLINARYGPFYIPNGHDLIAQSIRLYGEWAQLEIDVLASFIQEGDIVADIGSFIGSHARAFSEVAGEKGKVYAFEANSSIFPILEKNAELARRGNIAAFEIGLGSSHREMFVIKEDGTNQGATQFRKQDRKSTRLNSSHPSISYAVFCLKKKTDTDPTPQLQ